MASLGDPLTLPCGLSLPNRIVKAAMTEGIATADNDPGRRLERLYERFAAGGSGLILTGNAMVDRRHLERARNVVVDAASDEGALRRLAAATGPVPTLVQLSHPGRQVNRVIQARPVAPSAIGAVEIAGFFAPPRAMSEGEILEARDRFADASRRVVAAGFDGVQLHAAHGYLLSAFLSPEANRRTDRWGGELEGRARLLLETIAASRQAIGEAAAIGVKVNASGADPEAAELASLLAAAGCDLIEVSGGSYESPEMLAENGGAGAEEASFLAGARTISAAVDIPVALTGGLRTRGGIDAVLASGAADLVGLGRPLAVDPDLPKRLLDGSAAALDRPAPRIGGPAPVRQLLGPMANSGWHRVQLERHGGDRSPLRSLPAWAAAADYAFRDAGQALLALPRRRRRIRRVGALIPPAS